MFNFIKKTRATLDASKSSVNSEEVASAIEDVLANYQATSKDFETLEANKMTGLDYKGDTVTIDLRLNGLANPEEVHRQLSQRLHLLGIKEVNLNVSLPPKAKAVTSLKNTPAFSTEQTDMTRVSTKGSGNKLPKTTDATIKNTTTTGATAVASTKGVKSATNVASPSQSSKPQQQSQASDMDAPISKPAPKQASLQPHPRIKHIIVVASGKGGVGKSTTTVNIALALQKLGGRVGVLDADIYGPSMPTMLGVSGVRPALENEQFVPIDAHGLAMLSIGSLLEGDNMPVAWRGPKATGALMQLFNQTNWPMLDYLVIDMPPGTGDIQLTLAQRIPVTGAVIVTTPQHVALMDAQKGIEMFNKTSIPVLGVVENMALHTCSNCGHTEAIFGTGGGETLAEEYQVPLLGRLPLAGAIRAQVDKGEPSVIANNGEGDAYASFYMSIAENIEANIVKFAKKRDDGRIF